MWTLLSYITVILGLISFTFGLIGAVRKMNIELNQKIREGMSPGNELPIKHFEIADSIIRNMLGAPIYLFLCITGIILVFAGIFMHTMVV